MGSLTTFLQFCFVVFHYSFIYTLFRVIAMVDSVLVRVAGRPAGQLVFWGADCVMALLIEAAAFPTTGIRSCSMLVFLPALFFVQWWRIASSLTLLVLAGKTVSSKDVQGVLESIREMLQDVFLRGRPDIRCNSLSERVLIIKTSPEQALQQEPAASAGECVVHAESVHEQRDAQSQDSDEESSGYDGLHTPLAEDPSSPCFLSPCQ